MILAYKRSSNVYSTAQHSTAQHSTAQHSTAQHSTAQHSTALAEPSRRFPLTAKKFAFLIAIATLLFSGCAPVRPTVNVNAEKDHSHSFNRSGKIAVFLRDQATVEDKKFARMLEDNMRFFGLNVGNPADNDLDYAIIFGLDQKTYTSTNTYTSYQNQTTYHSGFVGGRFYSGQSNTQVPVTQSYTSSETDKYISMNILKPDRTGKTKPETIWSMSSSLLINYWNWNPNCAIRIFVYLFGQESDKARPNYYLTNEERTQCFWQQSANNDDKAREAFDRGFKAFAARDYQTAVGEYTKAIEIDPNKDGAYFNRGNAYSNLGDYNKAIADYTKAIEIDPNNNAFAYHNRGKAYASLGDYNKAIVDFTKAVELHPKTIGANPYIASAYADRGSTYGMLGDHKKEIADYTKVIEIDPKNSMAYNNRGFAYTKLGDNNKAVSDCTKAIEIDPNNAFAYDSRGVAYSNLGNHNKAIADFTKAIELYPQRIEANPYIAETYNNRGLAYEKLGDNNKATKDRAKACELDKRFCKAN